jgi:NADPH:quinone reductase-like Zn-dependent oxidoreductase
MKVKAIGLNRADVMWRNDAYIEPVKFPAGLGYEVAGIIDAVGKDVTGLAVGDVVSTIPAFSMNKYSAYGEVVLMPDYVVVKHPKSLSFTEAASIWMMFTTAYGALILDAQVTKGDFVIIPAASSSVGLAAIQLANYAGAGQLHEKLFTHNGLRMGVVNCCEEALTLGFAKSREWCGRRIRAVEFARRVWGPEGSACTHSGA